MVVVTIKINCFLSISTHTGSFTILGGLFLHVGGDFVLLEMDLQTHLSKFGSIHYINFVTHKQIWTVDFVDGMYNVAFHIATYIAIDIH
jgi:hypothetical protein